MEDQAYVDNQPTEDLIALATAPGTQKEVPSRTGSSDGDIIWHLHARCRELCLLSSPSLCLPG